MLKIHRMKMQKLAGLSFGFKELIDFKVINIYNSLEGCDILMDLSNEIAIAKNARNNAYAPHTPYLVGASLKCKSGKIYSGCNIQNDGIMSICAERVAFLKAISEGEREFEHIVVCGGPDINTLENCLPCGYCRQFMNEFVDSNFKIYAISDNSNITHYSISDLLPHSFKLKN